MSIKIVRMLSGEDILCECQADGNDYTIDDAVVVVPTQQQSVQFVPYSPFTAKGAITINGNMVVFVASPDKSLEDQHRKMFGGIITPDSSIIS